MADFFHYTVEIRMKGDEAFIEKALDFFPKSMETVQSENDGEELAAFRQKMREAWACETEPDDGPISGWFDYRKNTDTSIRCAKTAELTAEEPYHIRLEFSGTRDTRAILQSELLRPLIETFDRLEFFAVYLYWENFGYGYNIEYRIFKAGDTRGKKGQKYFAEPHGYYRDNCNTIVRYQKLYRDSYGFDPKPDSEPDIDLINRMQCDSFREVQIKPALEKWLAARLQARAEISDGQPKEKGEVFTIADGILKKYAGADADVLIPEGVTKIGKKAFMDCRTMKTVTVPKGVREIGENAFNGCRDLVFVNLPEGLREIGKNAFIDCVSLASVSLPEGLAVIGLQAFFNCGSLSSVTFPESLREIGNGAFELCASLNNLAFPKGLEKIGVCAFGRCSSLVSASLPDRFSDSVQAYGFSQDIVIEWVKGADKKSAEQKTADIVREEIVIEIGDDDALVEIVEKVAGTSGGTDGAIADKADALAAVMKNGKELANVPEHLRTAELCLAAVQSKGGALQYVPENLKTEELCRIAVQNSGFALRDVPENLKTPKICLEAVKKEGSAILSAPEELRTAELWQAAVTRNVYFLERMPESYKTAELCRIAVAHNGAMLEYVPENLKTEELCRLAIQSKLDEGKALAFVPARFKTPEFCLLAVQSGGRALEFVPGELKSLKLCLIALQQDPSEAQYVLKNVPKSKKARVKELFDNGANPDTLE